MKCAIIAVVTLLVTGCNLAVKAPGFDVSYESPSFSGLSYHTKKPDVERKFATGGGVFDAQED